MGPDLSAVEKGKMDVDNQYYSIQPVITTKEGEAYNTSDDTVTLQPSTTRRGLKSRHAIMLGIGGTIGTGLFVGSGTALSRGGPIALLIAYCLISCVVFGVVTATSEISSYMPVRGSTMAYFGSRIVSPSLGFAMGWMYWYVWAVTVPAEITAATLIIEYWHPPVPTAVWIVLFILIIVAMNFMPVNFYGESEFWFASIKVFGIIGLLFMSIVLILGGGPNHDRLGFRYWINPGPVNEYLVEGVSGRFVAFVATTTFSMFAFMLAPELLVVTAGEMRKPRTNLPSISKTYIIRLIVFYVLGAFCLGLIVQSNDPALTSGSKGAGGSPWAVAARRAGIRGLDSVINVVILTSAASAGNAAMYTSSRSLYSMSLIGAAPKIFSRCTKQGVPFMAIAFTALFSTLAFLNLGASSSTVFTWIVNFLNTAGFIGWICCLVIYLRFRKAIAAQDRIAQLPYRSKLQPYASDACLVVLGFLLSMNGFTNFLKGHWDTAGFITSYIGIAIFLLFYLGHRVTLGRRDRWARLPEDVDLVDGLDEVIAHEAEEEQLAESEIKKSWRKRLHLSRH